jgi:hypothetical protein
VVAEQEDLRFDGFISKPFAVETVLDILESTLKLVWIYPEAIAVPETVAPPSVAPSAVAPSATVVETFLGFALEGNLGALKKALQSQGSALQNSNWGQKLCTLLNNYDNQGIINFLQHGLKS